MQSQNKSLSKGLMILKKIMLSKEPLTANYLCQSLDIDKSTMSRLIATLVSEGFLDYVENSKEIILSDLMRKIVEQDSREKIIQKTQKLLDDIFYLTEEASYLGIYDNNSVLYLNQVDKSNRVLKTRNAIGLHAPLHSNAFGKVILASKKIDLTKLTLKKYTTNTIINTQKLSEELMLIKERGYAIGNEEHEYGLCSVAVPLFNARGEFIGPVGISGISIRLSLESLHEFGQKILALTQNSLR